MGAANNVHWFHPWLYTCTVQTADPNWFYFVPGFPLYEDTDLRRATAHQLYCFGIEVGFVWRQWMTHHHTLLKKTAFVCLALPWTNNELNHVSLSCWLRVSEPWNGLRITKRSQNHKTVSEKSNLRILYLSGNSLILQWYSGVLMKWAAGKGLGVWQGMNQDGLIDNWWFLVWWSAVAVHHTTTSITCSW